MSQTPRVLIYGFEPFLRYRRNVTQSIVEGLPQRPEWQTMVLPVRFEANLFLPLVEKFAPDYILGLGQCPRGDQIRVERRGHNQIKHTKQDPGSPIDPEGPSEIAPNWKIGPNSQRRLSYDAGRYVCNYSIYLLSRQAAAQDKRYAFLHIPRDFSVKVATRHIVQLLESAAKS